jgi:CubicO group peptidase (beta-lactamase class C family)
VKAIWIAMLVLGSSGCDAPPPDAPADAGADAVAPDASPDDLGGVLDPIRAQQGLPGLVGAVFRGGDLVAIGVSGVRKWGDPTAATTGDEWHLGSDTKAMTATLIGIYVDRGKLHFEDTIATLFAGETVDPGYANVTLLQLLQHRGGAPGDIPADIWSQMWADGNAPTARITAVRSILSRPPAQPPGTFVYANAGYMIAGAALERVVGSTWEQIIQQDLFGPLGMQSCGFGAPGDATPVDEPWGHEVIPDGGPPIPMSPADPAADNPPSLGPAGTVHCSLADWGRFFTVHLAGARGEPTSLLTPSTVMTLQTPPSGGDYACGWGVASRSWAGGTALTHSGSNTMWYATVWLAPAKNLAFAVATNRGDDVAANAVDSAFAPLIQRYAN